MFVSLTIYLLLHISFSHSSHMLRGVHPSDEEYYASRVIKCRDGSKSFARERLNDDFCDCSDGTDEPGTSACPNGKFYCNNNRQSLFIFSSQVNDRICDCCDGSDEYDGGFKCANMCDIGYYMNVTQFPSFDANNTETWQGKIFLKATGLKMEIVLQVVLVAFVVLFIKVVRNTKLRRRRKR